MRDPQLANIKLVLKEFQTSFPMGIIHKDRNWGYNLFSWVDTDHVLTLGRSGYAQLRIRLDIFRKSQEIGVESFLSPVELLDTWPRLKVFLKECLKRTTLPSLPKNWRLLTPGKNWWTAAPVEALTDSERALEMAIKAIPEWLAKSGYELLRSVHETWIVSNDNWLIVLDRIGIDTFYLDLFQPSSYRRHCPPCRKLHEISEFLEKFLKEGIKEGIKEGVE